MELDYRCYKFLLKFGGYFYVEKFEEENDSVLKYTREEPERAKIYDEYGGYLDYICLDGASNKEYWGFLSKLLESETPEQFLHSLDIEEPIISGDSILTVLNNYVRELEDEEEEELLQLRLGYNWTEKDLIEKYNIQKIGNLYFIILV